MAAPTRLSDALRVIPQDSPLSEFMDGLEALHTRALLKGLAYQGLVASAEKASSARTAITYFGVTASVGILTGYISMMGRTDDAAQVIRDYIPALGLALTYVLMLLGNSRYYEEWKYVAAAIEKENEANEERGAAAVQAEVLQFTNWWAPTRDHLAGFCVALFWVSMLIVQVWHS